MPDETGPEGERYSPEKAQSEAMKMRRILGEKTGELFKKSYDPKDYNLAAKIISGKSEDNPFVKKVQEAIEGSPHGIYGWFDLVGDAEEAGLKMDLDLGAIGKVGSGFYAKGRMDFEGNGETFVVTMTSGLYLVSTPPTEDGRKVIESGFAKLFMQSPNVVYKDQSHDGMFTAEWYLGQDEAYIDEQIQAVKSNPDYEVLPEG